MNSCKTLETFTIKKAPSRALYIPNFISEEEEEIVLRKLYEAPKPKWVHLSNRRLQNWGGLPHPKGMVAEPLPPWLKTCMSKVDDLDILDGHPTNHVLVNEYLPGQGIMPHEDGPLFYPKISTITLGSHTLLDLYKPLETNASPTEDADQIPGEGSNDKDPSLSECKSSSRFLGSLLLEPRSLLILENDLYTKHLHGIDQRHSDTVDESVLNVDMTSHCLGETLDRGTRVSLTIRYFPKVLKFKMMKFK